MSKIVCRCGQVFNDAIPAKHREGRRCKSARGHDACECGAHISLWSDECYVQRSDGSYGLPDGAMLRPHEKHLKSRRHLEGTGASGTRRVTVSFDAPVAMLKKLDIVRADLQSRSARGAKIDLSHVVLEIIAAYVDKAIVREANKAALRVEFCDDEAPF